ncbi:glutamate receptor 2-like isoform X2 [Haliotis asinina]|uniref:glutamate receptor 2-like isoform X2 n=1 Tax=Haliotis asinina TaxID=109174 RepID=UPI0035321268
MTGCTVSPLALALMLALWTCGPGKVHGLSFKCHLRNNPNRTSLTFTPVTRQEVYVQDVVALLSHLQWATITVLHDTNSEAFVDHILFLAVEKLQGVRYLIHNVDHMVGDDADIHTLLQSLHARLYPQPNILLIGRQVFILSIMSQVSTHDDQSNRTTDFRHLSRWLLVTDLDRQFLGSMINIIGDLENVAAVYRSDSGSRDETGGIPGNNSIGILTYSRSCPPDFVHVKITPPVMTGRSLLHVVYPNTKYGYNNRTVVVSTLMYAPFTIRRLERGQAIYEGYCFELLNVLAKDLNFSVQLVEPADGEWGLLVDGKWTGLIGQLQQRQSSRLMSSICSALCFGDDPVEHLQLVFWRIFGSVFKQGDPWTAETTPGRILMTSWWLLTVVLAAGYSAYLVAIFTVDIRVKPFSSLQDVVDSPHYKIGIMSTGIIKLIFEKSNQDDFQGAWQKVVQANKTDPRVLAGSEAEHLQHVLGGKYCWIVDVTTAEKAQANDCSLETVGVRLNGQNLALAVPTDSPLKAALEDTMAAIADSGLLDKWWKQWQKPRTPDMCPAPPDVHPIILKDVMGPVYIALGGVALAGLFLLLELLMHHVHVIQGGSQINKSPM